MYGMCMLCATVDGTGQKVDGGHFNRIESWGIIQKIDMVVAVCCSAMENWMDSG